MKQSAKDKKQKRVTKNFTAVVLLPPAFCSLPLVLTFAMFLRFSLLLFFAFAFAFSAAAQEETPIYKGLRISLFNFSIKKQKPESVSLKLSVANTGRLPVSFGKKNEDPPENLVVELDTVNLPLVLKGREKSLTDAVRKEKINLQPGEILLDMSLEIKLKTPDSLLSPPAETSTGKNCPDLIFDTAYIVEYTDKSMSFQFIVRNAGNAAARLLGASDKVEDNLGVNVYFNSSPKLTRGAIFAEGLFIQEGKETLDGVLLPGQALQGEIKISLANRTKFTPNIILELDPFQSVQDCDRTNNTRAILVEF